MRSRRSLPAANSRLPAEKVPYFGFSMGDANTPALFDPDRAQDIPSAMLSGVRPIVRVSLPTPIPNGPANVATSFSLADTPTSVVC